MARVTVEDCIVKVPNRFELVMLSAQRARELSVGAPLTVERDNDKNPVVALREIAEDRIVPGDLQEEVVRGLQKHADSDEPEEEVSDLLAVEEELAAAAGAEAEELLRAAAEGDSDAESAAMLREDRTGEPEAEVSDESAGGEGEDENENGEDEDA